MEIHSTEILIIGHMSADITVSADNLNIDSTLCFIGHSIIYIWKICIYAQSCILTNTCISTGMLTNYENYNYFKSSDVHNRIVKVVSSIRV